MLPVQDIRVSVSQATNVDTHLARLDNSRCQCHCSVVEQSRRPCTAEACQHSHNDSYSELSAHCSNHRQQITTMTPLQQRCSH